MKKRIYSGYSEGLYSREKFRKLMNNMNYSPIVESSKDDMIKLDCYLANKDLEIICRFQGVQTVIVAKGKEEEISKVEEIITKEAEKQKNKNANKI